MGENSRVGQKLLLAHHENYIWKKPALAKTPAGARHARKKTPGENSCEMRYISGQIFIFFLEFFYFLFLF